MGLSANKTNPLTDKWWRMNNLYWIVDEHSRKVKFALNPTQVALFEQMNSRNIVLKSRQHGVTTFIDIYILDECLIYRDISAAIIAHRIEDAKKIKRHKIDFPLKHLPEIFRDAVEIVTDSKEEITFGNGSSIAVSVSVRSGTVQMLHVSEYGYTCVKHPDKAEEILSGAIEAVHPGEMVFIESTSYGREGQFPKMCEEAAKTAKRGDGLTELDYKLHFFPWWKDPRNILDGGGAITQWYLDYFRKIEAEIGQRLSDAQRTWYMAKRRVLGELMLREHPSTMKECFQASVDGAYFAQQFRDIYEQRRITTVPVQSAVSVDTWWDLGMNDAMAIWFTQDIGRQIHVVDYYEHTGEGFPHYKRVLDARKYTYGRMVAPHDVMVKEMGSGVSRIKQAKQIGINFQRVPRVQSKLAAIEAARNILSICVFDETRCDIGIQRLESYRKEWDDAHGVWRDRPRHDENSNGADAFQTLACAHDFNWRMRASGALGKTAQSEHDAIGARRQYPW